MKVCEKNQKCVSLWKHSGRVSCSQKIFLECSQREYDSVEISKCDSYRPKNHTPKKKPKNKREEFESIFSK